MKKVLNFFGIVLAVIFSLVLIPTLIFNPVWRGVSGLLQPSALEELTTSLVEEIDLSQIALESPELAQALEEAGITPEAAQALLSSQTAKDIISLLGSDLTQVLQGSFTTSALTEAEALRIVNDNRAELIQIVRLMLPDETAALTDDQLNQGLDSVVAQEILPLLGDIDQAFSDMQAELHGELAMALELATGPMIPTALLVAALVLALLIFLCRWPHQEGLLWLGIDSALAALPVLGIAFSLKGPQLSQALAQTAGLPDVFRPFLRRMGNSTLIGGAILAAIAVVMVAGFILLRDRRLKKQAATATFTPAAPAAVSAAPFTEAAPETETTPEAEAAPDAEAAPEAERSPWDNV